MKHASQTHSRFEHLTIEEIEPLNSQPEATIDTNDSEIQSNAPIIITTSLIDDSINTNTKSHQQLPSMTDTYKIGADTFAGAAMIMIGTILYGIFGILNRLSMLGKRSTPYQSAAAVMIAECGKFIISALLLFHTEGIAQAIKSLKYVPATEWLLFSFPAALYSITNNLDFYILQYMDPGSMQVKI